jgi:hypothetical protein
MYESTSLHGVTTQKKRIVVFLAYISKIKVGLSNQIKSVCAPINNFWTDR